MHDQGLAVHLRSQFFERAGFVVQIGWRLQLDVYPAWAAISSAVMPGLADASPNPKTTPEIEITNRISHIV